MKNVNKWFYFNPLFILYTDDKSFIKALRDPNRNKLYYYDINGKPVDPFDYDERQMDSRDSVETESEIVNHPSANRLREQFKENQAFHDFLGYSLNYDFEKLPIALITFVLSVFVATDVSLRETFYQLYRGQKIPAITQWLLNTFRVSPISDNEWVTSFRFIDDEYRAMQFCCGLSVSFADKDYLKQDPEDLIAWFSVLEEHFNSDQKPYMEYVDFKRVAPVSTDKNYLCGLTAGDKGVTCSETAYFNELSYQEKEIYVMLAQVLDGVGVPENTELPVPHKNIVERDFDEGVIVPKLIGFIVSESKRFL